MSNWKALQDAVKTRFGSELDHEALLFIIGLQELAQVNRSFKKQEKLEIMHIAVCVLLAPYGLELTRSISMTTQGRRFCEELLE